jgi:hypothetical protein
MCVVVCLLRARACMYAFGILSIRICVLMCEILLVGVHVHLLVGCLVSFWGGVSGLCSLVFVGVFVCLVGLIRCSDVCVLVG